MKNKLIKMIGYSLLAIFFSVALSGCARQNATTQDSDPQPVAQEQQQPIVEVKDEAKTEVVAFETQQQNSFLLEKGKTEVSREGKNGTKEINYKVTYTDGKETSREKTSENIVTQPVSKLILIGTKEVVQTPCAGATAICGDGTCSYSANRRGTCSHHQGVSQWLD